VGHRNYQFKAELIYEKKEKGSVLLKNFLRVGVKIMGFIRSVQKGATE